MMKTQLIRKLVIVLLLTMILSSAVLVAHAGHVPGACGGGFGLCDQPD